MNKTVILNGSPRKKGNTSYIVNELKTSVEEKIAASEVVVLTVNNMDFKSCQACEGCKRTGGKCVFKDDTNAMISEILSADNLVFATPVYFFGMTAQLKLAIDKFYCVGGMDKPFGKKKIGIISVGGAATNHGQYDLISKQFKMMFDYIGWDIVFDIPVAAHKIGDAEKNEELKETINELYKSLI